MYVFVWLQKQPHILNHLQGAPQENKVIYNMVYLKITLMFMACSVYQVLPTSLWDQNIDL